MTDRKFALKLLAILAAAAAAATNSSEFQLNNPIYGYLILAKMPFEFNAGLVWSPIFLSCSLIVSKLINN